MNNIKKILLTIYLSSTLHTFCQEAPAEDTSGTMLNENSPSPKQQKNHPKILTKTERVLFERIANLIDTLFLCGKDDVGEHHYIHSLYLPLVYHLDIMYIEKAKPTADKILEQCWKEVPYDSKHKFIACLESQIQHYKENPISNEEAALYEGQIHHRPPYALPMWPNAYIVIDKKDKK